MKKLILFSIAGMLAVSSLSCGKKSTPSVVGLDLNTATAKLQESGFQVGAVAREYAGPDKPPGSVLRQDPGPGVRLASGAAVNLVLEYSLIMPNLVGQDVEAAKQILESRGFSAVRIDKIYQGTQPLGTVLTQDPPANLRVEANTLAAVAIDSYVVVPNLVGKPLETAVTTIDQLGLLMGDVTQKKSAGRDPGTVASQAQKPGAKVALGTSIDLGVVPEQSGFSKWMTDFITKQAEKQANKYIDKLGTPSSSPQPKGPTPVKNPAPPRATSSVPTPVSPPVVANVRVPAVIPRATGQVVQLKPVDPFKPGSFQPPR